MKTILTILVGSLLISVPAMAGIRKLNTEAGKPPQVLDKEPAPGTPMARFQVFYIDDHSCPSGQIKKFTAGSKSGGIRATRECITR